MSLSRVLLIGAGALAIYAAATWMAYVKTPPERRRDLWPDSLLQPVRTVSLAVMSVVVSTFATPLLSEQIVQIADNFGGPLKVNAYVRAVGEGPRAWRTTAVVDPGDEVEFMIRYENTSGRRLEDVAVANNVPKYIAYVPGSTKLKNGANPNGVDISSENLTHGGISVGRYQPGAVGYVFFRGRVDPMPAFGKLGRYDVRNVGVVRPEALNAFYNTARILIDVPDA